MLEYQAEDDGMTDRQLAAMDAVWRAWKAGEVSEDQADQLAEIVRHGHPHAARKRLAAARRRT